MNRYLVIALITVSLAMVGCGESSTNNSSNSTSSSQNNSSNAKTEIVGTWTFSVGDVISSQGSPSTANVGNMYYFENNTVTRAMRGSGPYALGSTATAGTPVQFSVTLPDFPGLLISFDGTMSGFDMVGQVTVTWPEPALATLVAEYTGRKLSSANTLP